MNRTYTFLLTICFGIIITFSVFSDNMTMDGKKSMSLSNSHMGMEKNKIAVFAGGCFWCVEADFEKVGGVIDAISGYAGGHKKNPTYEQVSRGNTGHVESVKVIYDPKKVTYEQLLDHFWRHIDPTDGNGQFVDRGNQYRSVIFYQNEDQKTLAEASRKALEASHRFDKPIATEIVRLNTFYLAEDYHQDYYKTHSIRYKYYRWHSGRDQFLEKVWGKNDKPFLHLTMGDMYSKPDDATLRQRLSKLQYRVTQENATERPFDNTYWDNKKAGIYVDIVSGEPLFSSLDKFDSHTGWPSFTRPLIPENIVKKKDRSFFMVRTEVRSKHGDSHLGHVFTDGPPPSGLRYCINSAALRFIPVKDLNREGYGKLAKYFK